MDVVRADNASITGIYNRLFENNKELTSDIDKIYADIINLETINKDFDAQKTYLTEINQKLQTQLDLKETQ
jgi:hypothetical protein